MVATIRRNGRYRISLKMAWSIVTGITYADITGVLCDYRYAKMFGGYQGQQKMSLKTGHKVH